MERRGKEGNVRGRGEDESLQVGFFFMQVTHFPVGRSPFHLLARVPFSSTSPLTFGPSSIYFSLAALLLVGGAAMAKQTTFLPCASLIYRRERGKHSVCGYSRSPVIFFFMCTRWSRGWSRRHGRIPSQWTNVFSYILPSLFHLHPQGDV